MELGGRNGGTARHREAWRYSLNSFTFPFSPLLNPFLLLLAVVLMLLPWPLVPSLTSAFSLWILVIKWQLIKFLFVGGRVFTWGRGTTGQLGHGEMLNSLHPKPVSSLQSYVITQVSAGWSHSGFVSGSFSFMIIIVSSIFEVLEKFNIHSIVENSVLRFFWSLPILRHRLAFYLRGWLIWPAWARGLQVAEYSC